MVSEEQAEYEVFFDEDEPPEDDPADMVVQPEADGTEEPSGLDRAMNVTPLDATDLVKGIPSGGGTWGVKNQTVPSSKGMLADDGNNALKVRTDSSVTLCDHTMTALP